MKVAPFCAVFKVWLPNRIESKNRPSLGALPESVIAKLDADIDKLEVITR